MFWSIDFFLKKYKIQKVFLYEKKCRLFPIIFADLFRKIHHTHGFHATDCMYLVHLIQTY